MADIALAVSKLSGEQDVDNPEIPAFYTATFATQDTNNNDMLFPASGKGWLLYAVDNPTDKGCVVSLFGMFSEYGEVGDADVFPISTAPHLVVATADKGYAASTAPFPWYLVRVAFAVAPTDVVAKTVSIFVSLMAY